MRRIAVVIAVLSSLTAAWGAEKGDSAVCPAPFEVKRAAAGAGVTLVVNAAATEVLKAAVHEMRPDRSDNSSFPSRHTSYAFAAASVAARELARFSPFWVPAVHTAANAVAMQRVYAGCHYPSDVLAGAALGIVSGEVGYAVSDIIFGRRPSRTYAADNLPAISASTVAVIPLGGHSSAGLSAGCGIESAVSFSLPASDVLSLGISARMRDMPVYADAVYAAMLKSFALTADGSVCTCLGAPCWQIEGSVSAGVIRNFSRPGGSAPAWSGIAAVSATVSRQLCRRLSAGARIGCDLTRRAGPDAALTVALVTRAQF